MNNIPLSSKEYVAQQSNFISKVYGWMCAALLITGFVAMFAASSDMIMSMIFSNMLVFWGLVIGELVLVGYLVSVINRISAQTATLIFIGYSVLNGLTLSAVFLIYTAGSIASTFFITAGTFAIMSVYGFTTKKDLTKLGSLAMMGLIGIIIASLVNFFLQSSALYWITTYIGILVFIGLIAYDTQKIKEINAYASDGEQQQKGAIMGALTLYLDFVNLFLLLLRVFGSRD